MGKTEKKLGRGIFSDLPILLKNLLIVLLLIVSICITWFFTVRTITLSEREKYRNMEDTAVTAAEQIINMSVETAISIAKNIYTNDAIYDFLNTRYASASEYYEVYYPLQQNTALNLSDTNIVKRCTIYTENPTILAGGNIQKLETVKSEYWFRNFQRLGKPTILCVNPDNCALVLVRKLDYRSLDAGDSYVCLEMNNAILSQFVENLGFAGELYVLSGSNVLYSSMDSVKGIEDVRITPEFDCLTHNYYTVDIEFYSCASRRTLMDHIRENRIPLILLAVVVLLIFAVSFAVFFNMRRRIRRVIREFQTDGSVAALEKGRNGRDEIGKLLDICATISRRAEDKSDKSRQDTDDLIRQNSAYHSLFLTALRQDAELTVIDHLPDLRLNKTAQLIPLADELELLRTASDKLGARFSSEEIPEGEWLVPAYSLLLIADDVFRRFIDPSLSVTFRDGVAYITFESPQTPKATDMLRLRAIFEDSNISEAYDFNRSYRFNPYMRLKACLGIGADIEITDRNMFRLIFKLSQQGGSQ